MKYIFIITLFAGLFSCSDEQHQVVSARKSVLSNSNDLSFGSDGTPYPVPKPVGVNLDDGNPIQDESDSSPSDQESKVVSRTIVMSVTEKEADLEYKNGKLQKTSQDLDFRGAPNYVLLWFHNEIPEGAVIKSAKLRFVASRNNKEPCLLEIYGLHDARSRSINYGNLDLSDSQVQYQAKTWIKGQKYMSSDLKDLLGEVLGHSRDHLGFRVTGNDLRQAYSYEGDRNKTVELIVELED